MSDQPTPLELTERRATRAAAIAFLVSIASGIALIAVYVAGGDIRLEGFLLFLGFGGVATGLGVWAKVLLDEPDVEEARPVLSSGAEQRQAFRRAYDETKASGTDRGRRRFLVRLLAGASASLGLALLLPFRSLGEPPGVQMFETEWTEGARLVGFDGDPVRPGDLAVGGVLTVFPEGSVGDGQSQTLVIRVQEGRIDLPEGAPPHVEGVLAFSKICTHAGCPIGLFRAAVGELFCPCHQSKFDVFRGAEPMSGPTTRALPQLPLGVDDEGYLVALGDFTEPVGPAFWNMNRDPGDV